MQVRHLTKTLAEQEQANVALNEQVQHLSTELKAKQDEFHKTHKALSKQVNFVDDFFALVKQFLLVVNN